MAEGGADLEDELGVCVSGRIQFEGPVESVCGCTIVDAGQEGEVVKLGATEVRGGRKSLAGLVGGTGVRLAISSSYCVYFDSCGCAEGKACDGGSRCDTDGANHVVTGVGNVCRCADTKVLVYRSKGQGV